MENHSSAKHGPSVGVRRRRTSTPGGASATINRRTPSTAVERSVSHRIEGASRTAALKAAMCGVPEKPSVSGEARARVRPSRRAGCCEHGSLGRAGPQCNPLAPGHRAPPRRGCLDPSAWSRTTSVTAGVRRGPTWRQGASAEYRPPTAPGGRTRPRNGAWTPKTVPGRRSASRAVATTPDGGGTAGAGEGPRRGAGCAGESGGAPRPRSSRYGPSRRLRVRFAGHRRARRALVDDDANHHGDESRARKPVSPTERRGPLEAGIVRVGGRVKQSAGLRRTCGGDSAEPDQDERHPNEGSHRGTPSPGDIRCGSA